MPQSLLELTSRFRIPRFEAGPDRLIRAAISNEHADALIYLLRKRLHRLRVAILADHRRWRGGRES
jgi:hypothetical protein